MYEHMVRILTAMLGFILGFVFAIAIIHIGQAPREYPMAGLVTEIDRESDTVVITEHNGNQWAFHGVEDYDIGDLVACVMSNNGTVYVEDDIILNVRYCG